MVTDIVAQSTTDPHTVVYHMRHQLVDEVEDGAKGFGEQTLGEFGRLLLEIGGVVNVALRPHLIIVSKAALYSWDEIFPEVEVLLSEYVRSQDSLRKCLDEILEKPGEFLARTA